MHKSTKRFLSILAAGTVLSFGGFLFSNKVFAEDPEMQSPGITLNDALQAGIVSNPQFTGAAAGKKAVDERLNQSKAGFLPSVDVRADAGYEHSDDVGTRARESDGDITLFRNDASVTLTQMLFDGFSTLSSVREQKAQVLSSALRLHATAELVGLSIVEAYLDVLRQRQLLMIAQKNIKEHQGILNLVEDGVKAGRSTKVDAEQVRARLAAAKASEAVTTQSLRNAEAEYYNTVGEAPGELQLPKIPFDSLSEDLDIEVKQTLVESPTLRATESDVEASKQQLKAADAAFMPQVDLQMNARSGNDLGGVEGHDTSAAALVVMNWNLYRGGADTARKREFVHRHEQTQAEREDTLRNLENDVRQTWASMVASGERAKQFQAQADANREVVSAYKDQFSLDRRTLLDVLDSQNELFVTQSNVVNAEFLEMFAVYRLMALKGNLLPALGVEYPPIDNLPQMKEGSVP